MRRSVLEPTPMIADFECGCPRMAVALQSAMPDQGVSPAKRYEPTVSNSARERRSRCGSDAQAAERAIDGSRERNLLGITCKTSNWPCGRSARKVSKPFELCFAQIEKESHSLASAHPDKMIPGAFPRALPIVGQERPSRPLAPRWSIATKAALRPCFRRRRKRKPLRRILEWPLEVGRVCDQES